MAPGAKVTHDASVTIGVIRMSEKFNTFPRAGGILDQDSLFILILQYVMTYDSQRAELDRNKAPK